MLSRLLVRACATSISFHRAPALVGWTRIGALICLASLASGNGRAEDAWIELRTPRFTIWSEASEHATRAWATEFELFCRGMDELIPVDQRSVAPANILLFRSDRRIRKWLPPENGGPSKASGYSDPNRGRTIIAISLEGARDDIRDLVYASALEWHLTGATRQLPYWFKMGLAQAFTTFVLHGNGCDVGANRPYMYRYLRVGGTLPFSQLMAIEPDDLSYSERGMDRTRQIESQCWATTEALLFTKDGVGWDAFRKYLRESPHGGTPSQELERTFGLDAATLDRRLAFYLEHSPQPERVSATFDRIDVDKGFVVRPLASWETDLALGSLLTSENRLDDADGYLSRAFLAAPDNPWVREERAMFQFAKEDYAAAAREAQRAIDGGRATYFNHYLAAYGPLHESDGELDEGRPSPDVLTHVFACIDLNPSFEAGYALLARIVTASDDAKAADTLLAAGPRFGDSVPIQGACALAAARRGDDEHARAYLAAAKALPDAQKARTAKYLETIDRAVTQLLDPVTVAARLSQSPSVTELTSATLDQASPEVVQQFVADLDRALENTRNATILQVRAMLRLRLNDVAGSLADITEAIQLAPKRWEYRTFSAQVRLRKGDFVGAIADDNVADQLHPNYGPIYHQRGYAETMAAQFPAALADYDRAIACEPNNAEYFASRGFARREKRDLDGALADLNHAIELDPNLARAFMNRAGVRSMKGDTKGAIDDIGRASTLRIQSGSAKH